SASPFTSDMILRNFRPHPYESFMTIAGWRDGSSRHSGEGGESVCEVVGIGNWGLILGMA
ncbi:MAG: hypothetical protein AABZ00_05590, partial [Chloroflexota bacterium]